MVGRYPKKANKQNAYFLILLYVCYQDARVLYCLVYNYFMDNIKRIVTT
ncbi:MAG: hypothetical protein DID91_2727704109 [Candidatus Nitrotoga sp. MKT]|nr:MAG: hypothetical protein DID91_2727704109 [Candidatus Nitrotoga sp. MKT]